MSISNKPQNNHKNNDYPKAFASLGRSIPCVNQILSMYLKEKKKNNFFDITFLNKG